MILINVSYDQYGIEGKLGWEIEPLEHDVFMRYLILKKGSISIEIYKTFLITPNYCNYGGTREKDKCYFCDWWWFWMVLEEK